MKTIFLFPNRYKKIGWVMAVPGLVLGILTMYFNVELEFLNFKIRNLPAGGGIFERETENFTNELAGIILLCGLSFAAFSKMKAEDEFTMHLRLDSLLWAVYANTVLMMLALLFTYGEHFFSFMVYNIFTIPVIFMLRFHYLLSKESKQVAA